jgi:hypothetical protein
MVSAGTDSAGFAFDAKGIRACFARCVQNELCPKQAL